MRHFPNLQYFQGGSGKFYALFLARRDSGPPDLPGIYLVTCTWWPGGIPGEGLVMTASVAGHSSHLGKVLAGYQAGFAGVGSGAQWQVAFLEVEEEDDRERYASDLQAALAFLHFRAA